MRKAKKPCEDCGHAKTHHAKGWIPLPNGGFQKYINFFPCQECECSCYKFNLDHESLISIPFYIEYLQNKIYKITFLNL